MSVLLGSVVLRGPFRESQFMLHLQVGDTTDGRNNCFSKIKQKESSKI